MYHIAVYVPRDHVESVKEAMFEAGAGRIGAYEKCSFEMSGTGQYRPLEGSKPFIGSLEKLEKVEEVKVEMVCHDQFFDDAIRALKHAHPYETPAYYSIRVVGHWPELKNNPTISEK